MPGAQYVRPIRRPPGASEDPLAREAELQAATIRGFLAGYGQALSEARELLGLERANVSTQTRRSRWRRWLSALG
jgi:hypothetical protein